MNCLTCENKDICKYADDYLQEENNLSKKYNNMIYINCNEYVESNGFKKYVHGEFVGNKKERIQYVLEHDNMRYYCDDITDALVGGLKLHKKGIKYEVKKITTRENGCTKIENILV